MVDINELTFATLAVAEVGTSTTDYIYSVFDDGTLPGNVRAIVNELDSIHTSLLQLEVVLRAADSIHSSKLNEYTSDVIRNTLGQCQQTFEELVQMLGKHGWHEQEGDLEEEEDGAHANVGDDQELFYMAEKLKQHSIDLSTSIFGLGRGLHGADNTPPKTAERQPTDATSSAPPEHRTTASTGEEATGHGTDRRDSPAPSQEPGENIDDVVNIVINFGGQPATPSRSDSSARASTSGTQTGPHSTGGALSSPTHVPKPQRQSFSRTNSETEPNERQWWGEEEQPLAEAGYAHGGGDSAAAYPDDKIAYDGEAQEFDDSGHYDSPSASHGPDAYSGQYERFPERTFGEGPRASGTPVHVEYDEHDATSPDAVGGRRYGHPADIVYGHHGEAERDYGSISPQRVEELRRHPRRHSLSTSHSYRSSQPSDDAKREAEREKEREHDESGAKPAVNVHIHLNQPDASARPPTASESTTAVVTPSDADAPAQAHDAHDAHDAQAHDAHATPAADEHGASDHDTPVARESRRSRKDRSRHRTKDPGSREPSASQSDGPHPGRRRDRSRAEVPDHVRRPSHRRRRPRRHHDAAYSSNSVTVNSYVTPYPTPPASTTATPPMRRSDASITNLPHPLQTSETVDPSPTRPDADADAVEPAPVRTPTRIQIIDEKAHDKHERHRHVRRRKPKKLSTWGKVKRFFRDCCCCCCE